MASLSRRCFFVTKAKAGTLSLIVIERDGLSDLKDEQLGEFMAKSEAYLDGSAK